MQRAEHREVEQDIHQGEHIRRSLDQRYGDTSFTPGYFGAQEDQHQF